MQGSCKLYIQYRVFFFFNFVHVTYFLALKMLSKFFFVYFHIVSHYLKLEKTSWTYRNTQQYEEKHLAKRSIWVGTWYGQGNFPPSEHPSIQLVKREREKERDRQREKYWESTFFAQRLMHSSCLTTCSLSLFFCCVSERNKESEREKEKCKDSWQRNKERNRGKRDKQKGRHAETNKQREYLRIFREAAKKVLYPPPLSGRASKKKLKWKNKYDFVSIETDMPLHECIGVHVSISLPYNNIFID